MTLSRLASSPGVPASTATTVPAPPRTASVFACVTTLTNTLLGVSVVGVAGGFARAGCAVGTLYLVLFACLSGSGLHLLARSSMTVSAASMRKDKDNDNRDRDYDAGDINEEERGLREGQEELKEVGVLPPSSFRSVALVGAPRWAFLIDVAVALKCFGVGMSYLVVVGDLMPTVMSEILGESYPDSMWRGRRVWVTVGFLLAAPLTFSRTLGALKYTATLAIGLVVFLSGMVLAFLVLPGLDACPTDDETLAALNDQVEITPYSVTSADSPAGVRVAAAGGSSSSHASLLDPPFAAESAPSQQSGGGSTLEDWEAGGQCFEGANVVGALRAMLQTLPLFVFCFTCHQNIFTICNEIVRPTKARVDTVIVLSMLIAVTTQLSIAWGAYATFGTGVEDDLLEVYPKTGLLTAARVCMSMLVTSCYPLQAHPSRLCILSIWKVLSSGDAYEAYSGLATDEEGGKGEQANGGVEEVLHHGLDHDHTDMNSRYRDEHGPRSSTSTPSLSASPAPVDSIEGVGLTNNSNRKGYGYGYAAVQDEPDPDMDGCGEARGKGGGRGDDAAGPTPRPELGSGVGDADFESSSEREGLMVPLSKVAGGDNDGAAMSVAGDSVGVGMSAAADNSRRVSSPLGFGGVSRREVSGEREMLQSKHQQQLLDEKQEQKDRAFWTSRDGFRHVLVTAAFLGFSYAIAICVDDLGVVLEVVGATGSTTITFILPGLLYLKVHPEPHPKRSLAALQLLVGILIIPVALTFIALGDSAERRR